MPLQSPFGTPFGVPSQRAGGGAIPFETDIHNGISNPNFTYTGGQAIVPDENGILRYTPPGVPAIEGGRYIDTVEDGAELGPDLLTVAQQQCDSGWTVIGESTVSGVMRIYSSTGVLSSAGVYSILSKFRRYEISYEVTSVISGAIKNSNGLTIPSEIGLNSYLLYSNFDVIFVRNAVVFTDITIDNVSVREIIPRWERPTGSTYISIPTRKGVRQVQTDPLFKGQLIEPAMTNKLTIVKANPTAVTGITVAGGAAVTVINDLTALTAAGLHKTCLTNAYNLSIPQNGTVTLPGAVANLNPHSISAELRLVSGTGIQMGLTGALVDITLTSAYQRIKMENLTPLVATDLVTFKNLNADTAVVRMILPQLEESPFCTSPIIGTDTAAAQTRQANVTSAPTAGVFPMVSATEAQDFAVLFEAVPIGAGQTATLFSTRIDDNNLFKITTTATAVGAVLRKSSTDNAASVALTHAADTKFQVIVVKSALGISVKCRTYSGAAWGDWTAWGTNETAGAKAVSPVGTTYQIGALNSINQFAANDPLTCIIKLPPKATLAEYQTWIEEELTRRGLI